MNRCSPITPPILALALALALILIDSHAFAQEEHHQDHTSHTHGIKSIGVAGEASMVSRTVEVEMTDAMRFTPDHFSFKRGQTIRFLVKNSGKVKHEFNLGTLSALNEHKATMIMSPDMVHSEPNVASVEPGKSGEVIWRFTKAGTVNYACLQPGHFEAGMKGAITIASK
jgi:uncharacterized cupredoxin-like copper-binding protein